VANCSQPATLNNFSVIRNQVATGERASYMTLPSTMTSTRQGHKDSLMVARAPDFVLCAVNVYSLPRIVVVYRFVVSFMSH
jgi:hypothetical protein